MAGPGGIKSVQSTVAFQDPQGNVAANGVLLLELDAPAVIAGTGGQVAPTAVAITLTSAGLIPTPNPHLWANDQLNPTGTLYRMRLFNSNGLLIDGPNYWSITGSSPIDLSQETPVSTFAFTFAIPPTLNASVITSSGSFAIPSTKLKVTCVGGGGAGGGSNGANVGLGGGGGAMTIKWLTGLTINATLAVSIGVGGTGNSALAGSTGASTTVASGTQTITTIAAPGGVGGAANVTTQGLGGVGGGPGTGGDLNLMGPNAANFVATNVGGAGGGSPLSGGGAGQGVIGSNGQNANTVAWGAGGSGSQGTGPFAGGSGTQGAVIFEWVA